MISANSRGAAVSAYIPAFSKGAKIYHENIQSGTVKLSRLKAFQITGTIISSGITYGVNHGLGAAPALVMVAVRSTKAHISAGATVGESSASARSTTKFYVVGQPHGVKYVAYVSL